MPNSWIDFGVKLLMSAQSERPGNRGNMLQQCGVMVDFCIKQAQNNT